MKVLIGCEVSGTVREAFKALGVDAWSCDIVSSDIPGQHIVDDLRNVLDAGWDMAVMFPPCTYLSYVGNRHWNAPGRAYKRREAMEFFMACVNAPIPHIAIENPLGYAGKVYRKPDQIINPYLFGEPVKKRTCLWLKNLPALWYWNDDDGLFNRTGVDKPDPLYYLSTTGKPVNWVEAGTRSAKVRSKTFNSIAAAMANQWTDYLTGKQERMRDAS